MLITALLSWFLVGLFIRVSKARGWGQPIRQDGPQTHLVKAGTPTAGGVGFVIALTVVWAVGFALHGADPRETVILLAALAMGFIGLVDDVLKIRSRMVGGKKELLAREKFPLQFLVGLVFAYFAWRFAPPLPPNWGPFFEIPIYALVMVAAVNAFNFTDGLDGLLSGVAIVVLLPFLGVSPLAALMVGGLLGFLWFNHHKARVFMGDMGSHALGAVAAGVYVMYGRTWYFPLAAVIPVVEVVSVFLQVGYFRRTGGKRLFLMTPIHHHFEKLGWPETQVTVRFWLVTGVAVALAWTLMGGRAG